MPTYFPRASRFIPRPVSARALTPPEPRTTSRIYPASIRRSRCSSEMVRCIGLLPTSVKDANSSLVSRVSRKEKEDKRLSTMTLDFRVKVLGFGDKVLQVGDAKQRKRSDGPRSPRTPTVI